jgi:selenocysteine lyase/cysteine desulfurase
MDVSRRKLVQGLGAISLLATGVEAEGRAATAASADRPPARAATLANADASPGSTHSLPVKAEFPFEGTHLNAAFAHPLGTVAIVANSIAFIDSLGVERIARYREPLLRRLQDELPRHGLAALTPEASPGPSVAFAYEGARVRFGKPLEEAGIVVTCGRNRIRISVSVYNDMQDIDKVLGVLCS